MKILFVGNSGRSNAMANKLSQSDQVDKIFFVPGNGYADRGKVTYPEVDNDFESLAQFCQDNSITYVVPDGADILNEGIVDYLKSKDIKVFGPEKEIAKLESSKSFGKDFMNRHNIPNPYSKVVQSTEEVREIAEQNGYPVVVKADWLMRGEGVYIAETLEELGKALSILEADAAKQGKDFRVLVEEYIVGPEVSIHLFYDGKDYVEFPLSQDHKPVLDGNEGFNTGGMGTYTPLEWVDEATLQEIRAKVIEPTIKGLKDDGIDFSGCIFPGVMLTKKGPMLLEYNLRLGSPEAQSYMMAMESDLNELLLKTINKELASAKVTWRAGVAMTVFVSPLAILERQKDQGSKVIIPEDKDNLWFLPSFLNYDDGDYYTTGSNRVLCVTGYGDTVDAVREAIYSGLEIVEEQSEAKLHYRKDIGKLSNVVPTE